MLGEPESGWLRGGLCVQRRACLGSSVARVRLLGVLFRDGEVFKVSLGSLGVGEGGAD